MLAVLKLFHHCGYLNRFHCQADSHFTDFLRFFPRNCFVCLDGVPHSLFDVEFQRHKRLFNFFQFFPDDILALVRAGKWPEPLVCSVQFLVYQLANVTSDYIHCFCSFIVIFSRAMGHIQQLPASFPPTTRVLSV